MTARPFKEGQRWRRRDRVIMTIYRVLEGIDTPIVALTPARKIVRYHANGLFIGTEHPHDFDLIAPTRMAE